MGSPVAILDRRSVLVGMLIAIAIALPAGVLANLVGDDAGAPIVLVLLLPILAGFAAGGYVAAVRAPAGPLANGAVAAVAAFAVIQGVGVVRRLWAGEAISLPSLAFAAVLAYSCGLLGAVVAQRVQPRGGARQS